MGTPTESRVRASRIAACSGLLALLLGLLLPADAQAWSNGTNGPNTFGTHDWIVREGVRLAGRESR